MIPQRIQRQRMKGWRKPEGAVYVGRGSKWGNPWAVEEVHRKGQRMVFDVRSKHHGASMGQFVSKRDAARWACVGFRSQYAADLEVSLLAGKDLMCWCPLTEPCHADVLLELANGDRLPVGTPVLYWPGARVGEGRTSVTRTPIWKIGDGTEVVSVEGYPGGIALTHIQTLPVGATTTAQEGTP